MDYLNNNLIIAHYCGFNIMKPLPSYWTFDRFIRNLDNALLKKLMQSQVLKLSKMGIIDTSFIALDSTPISANTKQNNPKSFAKNKFAKGNQPKSDEDCGLGVHTASNQHNERNFEYYWGYKNHILVDCITGLPIFEMTTTADVADSTVVLDILSQTNDFLSIEECTFFADKGYDVKAIYNAVKIFITANALFPSTSVTLKIRRSFQQVIRFVKPVSLCTKTANSLTMAELAKNTAVRSNVQNQAVVHAITRIGTMAKKLAVVLNMSRFPMITDFPLTVNVFRSRRFMHSEQRLSVTTLVSSRPVRNVFGCIALMLHKTLILLLILLCSLSLTQLLSLNSKALIAVLNPLSVLLDELF